MGKTIITQKDNNNQYFMKDHIYYIEQEKDCIAVAIDLTLMFGKGNEPTDINDQRIKDLEYKPYRVGKDFHEIIKDLMTSKEAIPYLKENYVIKTLESDLTFNIIEDDLKRLEKLNKAIEIIKSKPFSFNMFSLNIETKVKNYNKIMHLKNEDKYTQDEWDLLIEVFKNGNRN